MEETNAVTNPLIVTFKRLAGIFFAPRATFTALSESIHTTDIVIPLLLLWAISLAIMPVVQPIAMEEQTQKILQSTKIPDDQKDRMLDQMEVMQQRTSGATGAVLSVVVSTAWYAVLAGALMFFGSFIMGGQATFKATFTVLLYSQMVSIIETALKVPLMVQAASTQVETGLALLLPAGMADSLIYRFFHRLDLFSAWKVILAAMGLALIYRVDEKRTRLLLLGSWVLIMFFMAWLIDGRAIAIG
ncbi:MAG: YIP1 family protein [Candidatus Marinimicrobia bacterium]|nr:YIP1 family protein [Candidatus Neomarinimicrobiota bacterium]